MDVDTIVLHSLDFCYQLLAVLSFLVANGDIASNRRWVWHDSIDQCDLIPGPAKAFAANTGFIASKRSALSLFSAEERLPSALSLKPHMQLLCMEQPFLNYLMVTSGHAYTSLNVLRGKFAVSVPCEIWAGLDLHNGKDGLPKEPDICFVHWAGIWQQGVHRTDPTWQYYHALHNHLLEERQQAAEKSTLPQPGLWPMLSSKECR